MTRLFGFPAALLLLLAIPLAAAVAPRLGLRRPLRGILFALLVLFLAEPRIGPPAGIDVWVLLDRSDSAADLVEPRAPEILGLLERSKGARDRLFVVDFASSPRERNAGSGERFTDDRGSTRLRLALDDVAGRIDARRSSRVLLVTDGWSTEPLAGAGERLLARGVAVDLRLLSRPGPDVQADEIRLPQRVQPGEPFLLELRASGNLDGDVPIEVLRDGRPAGRATVRLRHGRGVARVTDRLSRGGAVRYTARLAAPGDVARGNDAASGWVTVDSGPRILLVTSYPDDPVAAALRAQGFAVDLVPPGEADVGRLAGARAVILHDVAAPSIPAETLRALDLFVRGQGGGLAMLGGRRSFGSGGWFGSPADPLLPVSMELRQEHRKIGVALAIVLDRSGSMAAAVPGGFTKMDLADDGAARSLELLGPADAIAVIAVDSEPDVVVPLGTVPKDKADLTSTIRSIGSSGGGIFVGVGLHAGWDQLKGAPQKQRHLILFADAADAEEPADSMALLEEMKKGGATVSVIGMGSAGDVDAKLLEEIAARGGGRMFYSDATDLPAIFAQETVAIARSAFLEQPVEVRPTAGWLEIASRPLTGFARIDGYNLSYLRPGATAAAFSGDEYEAPLVAFWTRGAGRAAAVSFPLAGEASTMVRSSPEYAGFVQTLGRWLAAPDVPPGIALRTRLDGLELSVDLSHDGSWTERFGAAPPELLVAGADGAVRAVPWRRIAPGRFRASRTLRPGERLRGAVRAGSAALPFGPVEGGAGAEWVRDPLRLAELAALRASTGGKDRTALASIWSEPATGGDRDLSAFLGILFLLLLVLEAFVTRIGWKRAERWWVPFRRSRAAVTGAAGGEATAAGSVPSGGSALRRARTPAVSVGARPADRAPEVSDREAVPAPAAGAGPSAAVDEARRRSRFEKAKKGT